MESTTNDFVTTPVNPMVFYKGFQHISEYIFDILDIKSLQNCRRVSKSWQDCIDNQNILWIKIAENQETNPNEIFQLSCKRGNTKLAQALIKKSIE